jgi:hypothetical protein
MVRRFGPGRSAERSAGKFAHDLADNFWEQCGLPEDGRDLWRQYHAAELGYVVWNGRSDDSADSTADDDLDGDCGTCAICGCERSDCVGGDHDYEPLPEPCGTGEYLIAREDLWQCDGYLTWPEPDDPCADVPGWGVAEVYQRGDDLEWWPEWTETGLTLDQAAKAAEGQGIDLGSLLGSIW